MHYENISKANCAERFTSLGSLYFIHQEGVLQSAHRQLAIVE